MTKSQHYPHIRKDAWQGGFGCFGLLEQLLWASNIAMDGFRLELLESSVCLTQILKDTSGRSVRINTHFKSQTLKTCFYCDCMKTSTSTTSSCLNGHISSSWMSVYPSKATSKSLPVHVSDSTTVSGSVRVTKIFCGSSCSC